MTINEAVAKAVGMSMRLRRTVYLALRNIDGTYTFEFYKGGNDPSESPGFDGVVLGHTEVDAWGIGCTSVKFIERSFAAD